MKNDTNNNNKQNRGSESPSSITASQSPKTIMEEEKTPPKKLSISANSPVFDLDFQLEMHKKNYDPSTPVYTATHNDKSSFVMQTKEQLQSYIKTLGPSENVIASGPDLSPVRVSNKGNSIKR